jgi:hypothetical protein
MVVPHDVRAVIGQAVIRVPTGRGRADHRQGSGADQGRSRYGTTVERITAEQLAERCRVERASDPHLAEITRITDVIVFVLRRVTISHHRSLPFR